MRQCLEEIDVPRVRKLWAHMAPHLPQDGDDAVFEVMLHTARTSAASIPLKLRAYSHRWLIDRGHRSLLPDDLKPDAERMYPRIVSAVGISVKMMNPELAAAGVIIRGAMEDAVYEAEADGRLTDDTHVKGRMREARQKARRQLFGR